MEKPTQLLGQPKGHGGPRATLAWPRQWRGPRWAPASAAATDGRGPRVSETDRGKERTAA